MDEIVDHYPDACGGAGVGSMMSSAGRRAVRSPPGRRVAADQRDLHRASHAPVALSALPRTDQRPVAAGDRRVTVRAEVAGGAGDVDRPASDLAAWDHGARPRSVRRRALDRRGRRDLPARLEALAGPHLPVAGLGAGSGARCMSMRPAGGLAVRDVRCGPRPPREATFLQIAEHCNREQFDALIGPRIRGSWSPTAGTASSHLDPRQRQVCWSPSAARLPPPRRRAGH